MDNHQRAATGSDALGVQHVMAYMQAGRSIEARSLAHRLLERDGESPTLLLLLGAIHDQLGLWRDGLPYAERYRALAPDDPQSMILLARLLHRAGRSAEAIGVCNEGLLKHAGNVDLLLHKAEAQDQSRHPQAALETLQPLLSAQSVSPVAAGLAARALHSLGRSSESVSWATRGAEATDANPSVSRGNWMQVCKVHDSHGRYDEAMRAAMQAHAVAPGTFDQPAFMEQIESQITTFAAKNLPGFARASNESELPVFLVGMPRSGTSLVEQIIASHPMAHGGGELSELGIIARTLMSATGSEYLYPDCVDDLTIGVANELADRYLKRLRAADASALRITNKAVDQYEHVGLMWLLFPRARIIHVHRDPLDNCLSCYTRFLNSNVMPYVTSLEHLGLVYRQNQRLMEHWKRTLDIPILTVRYEELVGDQRRVTGEILDFLGLPWDDRCLRYWEADRTVMTLSYDQVDKPIYDSSIGRWRNYERHLGPLRSALSV